MVIDVLNNHIKERGIPKAELARRAGLNYELLRRSLAGSRMLPADEFLSVCMVLGLDTDDFDEPEPTEESDE